MPDAPSVHALFNVGVFTYFFLRVFDPILFLFFFFNDTATTEIYTLSLHDALPILKTNCTTPVSRFSGDAILCYRCQSPLRSEEHTSELQSLTNLVCRLLLEKKKESTPGGEKRRRRQARGHSRPRRQNPTLNNARRP